VAIEFRCACGALCRAEDDQVGQLFHCEACGVDIPVPSPDEAAGGVEGRGDAAEVLRQQLGGGGAADLAAGLREQGVGGEDAERRREGAEALRSQLGGGGAADLADAIQDDLREAAIVEDESPKPVSHEADLEDLADQAFSYEEKAQASEAAERQRAATEALRSQLGGGGAADLAASLREQGVGGEDAERRREGAEALRAQLGGGGAADLAKALRGEADTASDDGAGAPTDEGAPGAPAGLPGREAGTKAAAASFRPGAAGRRMPPKKKVLRGHERAAHHFGFKRFIWFPSMLVGLVCVAVGVGAAVFHVHPGWKLEALRTGKPSPYEQNVLNARQYMAQFYEKLKANNIPVDGFEILQDGGRAWAIPKGAEHRKTSTGSVYYVNESGFDEPAVSAEEYAKSQAAEAELQVIRTRLLWFGVGLMGVGGILAALSLFALRDVLIVGARRRKGEAAEAGDETAEDEAAEVVPEEGAEAAEVAPGELPEGETDKDKAD